MRQQSKNTELGIHYLEILLIEALLRKYPNDTDLGREIRRLYKPKKECTLFYTYDNMNIGEDRLCATCGQPESKH